MNNNKNQSNCLNRLNALVEDAKSQCHDLLMKISYPHIKILRGGIFSKNRWHTGFYLYDTVKQIKMFEPVFTANQAWEKGWLILQAEDTIENIKVNNNGS